MLKNKFQDAVFTAIMAASRNGIRYDCVQCCMEHRRSFRHDISCRTA